MNKVHEERLAEMKDNLDAVASGNISNHNRIEERLPKKRKQGA